MDPQILQEKTLENCFQFFLKIIPKSLQFQAAYELLGWLQDDLLTVEERINGIFILLEHSKSPENVFLNTVTELVDISPYPWEKLLISEWHRHKDIKKLSAEEVRRLSGDTQWPSLKKTRGIRPFINAGTKEKHKWMGRFEPEFLRPVPEFYEVKSCETCWLTPLTVPEVVWDGEGELDKAFNDGGIRDLFKKALTHTLTIDQSTSICEFLQASPHFFHRLGISNEDILNLVNHNPSIASDIIVHLHNTSKFQDILDLVINMTLSLHVLEVVNDLYMKIEIPSEAIHFFISNCIQECKTSSDGNYNKKRMVRLLCVFISSIIKNKFNASNELAVEISSFCSDNSDIKEANQLFKSLKNIE